MSYSETLSNMITDSHLTLREVSERCKQLGVQIDPSYISKLQSGKQSPASDEVNTAIAQSCNGDVELLLYEAYLEKAPDVIKGILNSLSGSVRNLWKLATKSWLPLKGDIDRASILELSRNFALPDNITKTLLNDEKQMQELLSQYSTLGVNDNSMAPTIPKGAEVKLWNTEAFGNGDIVLAEVKGIDKCIRRYYRFGEQVVLMADNNEFQPIVTDAQFVTVMARVTSSTVNFYGGKVLNLSSLAKK